MNIFPKDKDLVKYIWGWHIGLKLFFVIYLHWKQVEYFKIWIYWGENIYTNPKLFASLQKVENKIVLKDEEITKEKDGFC